MSVCRRLQSSFICMISRFVVWSIDRRIRESKHDSLPGVGRGWPAAVSCVAASIAAAGAAAAAVIGGEAQAAAMPGARVSYPTNRLANLADLKPNEPLEIAYPDADSPGVLIKLGTKVATGRRPRRRRGRLLDPVPAQGLSPALHGRRQGLRLPRPLFALRRRERRHADLGAGDTEPARSSSSPSTTRATSTPRASTS